METYSKRETLPQSEWLFVICEWLFVIDSGGFGLSSPAGLNRIPLNLIP